MFTQIKRLVIGMLIVMLVTAIGAAGPAGRPKRSNGRSPRSQFKISLINYSVQNVLSYIYGKVLEDLGYNVEYLSADYIGQFEGIANGDIHVGIDMWETTTRNQLAEYVPIR